MCSPLCLQHPACTGSWQKEVIWLENILDWGRQKNLQRSFPWSAHCATAQALVSQKKEGNTPPMVPVLAEHCLRLLNQLMNTLQVFTLESLSLFKINSKLINRAILILQTVFSCCNVLTQHTLIILSSIIILEKYFHCCVTDCNTQDQFYL